MSENNAINDEIREQIKTEEGFKMFMAMSVQQINSLLKIHDADIKELKSWKDKMHGVWWAIVGLGVIVSIIGIKIFV